MLDRISGAISNTLTPLLRRLPADGKKRSLYLAFAGGSVLILAMLGYRFIYEQTLIREARAAIAGRALDPDSIIWRNERVVVDADSGSPGVCGSYNAKNSFGGYVGFGRYAYVRNTSGAQYFQSIYDEHNVGALASFVLGGIDRICGTDAG